MKQEYKQLLFNHFWFEMEHLKEPCMTCEDMDCKRSCIQKYLKKKFDIIDWKSCIKECKQRSELYQKVLRNSFWKPFSMRKCFKCKKQYHFLDGDVVTELLLNKSHICESIHLCNKCLSKYKRSKKSFLGKEYKRLF